MTAITPNEVLGATTPMVTVHRRTIDRILVGSGAVVLHRAVVESGALVGAGAVVSGGTTVPSGAMALGIPAKIRLDAVTPEMIDLGMQSYVHRSRRYRAELRRID